MKPLFFSFLVLFGFTCRTFAQNNMDSVKEELKKLWAVAQTAAQKKDRQTLERVYADEFLFIHSSGEVDNKSLWINNILSIQNYSIAPAPTFDELYVYGEAAVLRVKGRNTGTTIYAKKNGQWQVVQVQSTQLPPERKLVKIDPKILDQYVGKYEQAPGVYTTISKEGDTLMAQGMNRPKVILLPLSDTKFAVKDNIGEFTFYKNEKGSITYFILNVNGREVKGTKIE
jgi:hypothetical protein